MLANKTQALFTSLPKTCVPFIDPYLNPTSLLKHRILESVVRLADNLDVPIGEIGYLFDRALPTGTHMNFSEFLHMSEHEDNSKDIENALGALCSAQHGYMLFFVKMLPRTNSNAGEDWARKYALRGFRLSHLLRVRDYLVETTGADRDAVDTTLLSSRDYWDCGTKVIVQSHSTHLALFATRGVSGVSEEVLVYEKAKHQVCAMFSRSIIFS